MKEYLNRYKNYILWSFVFAFVVHGAKLNSRIVGIDTEDLIHLGTPFYDGWLNTGRQGLVLLKCLTGTLKYNPYYAGLMTVLGLGAAVAFFVLLWERVGDFPLKNQWHGAAIVGGIVLWISHPVLVEQFYFTIQGAEICVGMALTALALWLVYTGSCSKGINKWIFYLISGALLLITFSVYQILVVFFIFGTLTVLVLKCLNEKLVPVNHKKAFWGMIKDVLPYAGVFLGAFLVNSIITKLFFSESNYLSNQIRWGQLSVRDCIYSIAVHCRDVFCGRNSIFYSWILGVLCFAGLVAVLLLVKRFGFVLVFYYVALMTTPFLMTVVCADVPAIRSQLILPAFTGFILYFDVLLLECLYEKNLFGKRCKWFPGIVLLLVLGLMGTCMQTQTSLQLYYTDACRYAEDEALGRDLIVLLEGLIGEDDTPIVVIGSRPFEGNNACVKGEMVGRSVFEHDVNEEPKYYWSTRRVVGFLHTLGYDCEQLPDKNISYAVEFAEDMHSWPADNSVTHAGDMIVIKLSEIE